MMTRISNASPNADMTLPPIDHFMSLISSGCGNCLGSVRPRSKKNEMSKCSASWLQYTENSDWERRSKFAFSGRKKTRAEIADLKMQHLTERDASMPLRRWPDARTSGWS